MSQFKNLVFEGGGVKGIAYAGAIKVLDEKGLLDGVERVAGTSAGAITATLLAMGAKWDDIRDIVGGTDFRHFMDDGWGFIGDLFRLLTRFGWYKGDAFSTWIRAQIEALSGNPDLTFGELKKLAQAQPDRYRQLFVVGSNLSAQTPRIYSAEDADTADIPIWRAVRISMSIPMFFAAVKDKQAGHIYADGGITWNYPLDLFDEKKYLSDAHNPHCYVTPDYPTTRGSDHVYNKETLGFRVDTRDEIAAEKYRRQLPPLKILNIIGYTKALTGFMMEMANKSHLHKNDWHRTVYIDAMGVRTTQFDLGGDAIAALLNSGESSARDYFSWFEDNQQQPCNRIEKS